MKLIDFTSTYPDEASCKAKFKELRKEQGIVCKRCGCRDHYWKSDRDCFECKECGSRMSLKSGTVMHKSKLPYRYWFIAIHLLTSTKKSFSSLEMQHQLQHKRYQPIWHMMHKLRDAMGKRDEIYKLSGEIELDEGFFSTDRETKDKDEPLKRGRGSQRKTKVLVMAESQKLEGKDLKNPKKPRRVKHLKMTVIPDLGKETITSEVKDHVEASSKIVSDDSTSYVDLKNTVAEHQPKVVHKKEIGKELPWVHIAISNAKRLFQNTYHHVAPKYMQKYLDEFCYMFNRRYFGEGLFDRLLVACVSAQNDFRITSG